MEYYYWRIRFYRIQEDKYLDEVASKVIKTEDNFDYLADDDIVRKAVHAHFPGLVSEYVFNVTYIKKGR